MSMNVYDVFVCVYASRTTTFQNPRCVNMYCTVKPKATDCDCAKHHLICFVSFHPHCWGFKWPEAQNLRIQLTSEFNAQKTLQQTFSPESCSESSAGSGGTVPTG